MNLKENIRKVLKEESKDLSKQIRKVVDFYLRDNDPDKNYVLGYELEVPRFHGEPKYKLIIHLNSGPNSKLWPRTQAVRTLEEAILNEIQDYVLNYVGVYVQMWGKSNL